MSIMPVLTNHPFGPEEVQIIASAFDEAWDTIKRSGSTFAAPRYERGARDIIAKRIIELAKRGIMDRHELCADAVAYLTDSYREERDPNVGEVGTELRKGTGGA